eukprot:6597789-Pyramimonas_sp.AAC.1
MLSRSNDQLDHQTYTLCEQVVPGPPREELPLVLRLSQQAPGAFVEISARALALRMERSTLKYWTVA